MLVGGTTLAYVKEKKGSLLKAPLGNLSHCHSARTVLAEF